MLDNPGMFLDFGKWNALLWVEYKQLKKVSAIVAWMGKQFPQARCRTPLFASHAGHLRQPDVLNRSGLGRI